MTTFLVLPDGIELFYVAAWRMQDQRKTKEKKNKGEGKAE